LEVEVEKRDPREILEPAERRTQPESPSGVSEDSTGGVMGPIYVERYAGLLISEIENHGD